MSFRNRLRTVVIAGGLASLVCGAGAATPPARPHRIVSLNLCADQYLLALADRDQIAGLTRNANNPDMSAEAARTRGIRLLGQSAEEVLEIEPDLIVGMPMRRAGIMSAIAGRGYRTMDLKMADSYADIVEQIRQIAVAVGHPERGEAMIRRMDAELATIPKAPHGGVAAYYQRRGFLSGSGTLIDDLMLRVGLTNLATKLDKPVLSQMSLEEVIASRPDYLIMESATRQVTDQGTEMLHHPLLRGIRRLYIPQAWTVCGGPAYVLAARSLSRQISAR
ncbi:ABC transporter substrate-binding protein [Sphingomonas sp. AP4-R1]|uniref:ABC transporter substrate-binding protein n=1 Tax=Sphingomonas sp. AP4-R1 TaxID=2735134 RepID=UPI0014933B5C|nr:ABC transporter substrate-binding protein [Sphingomonas sp. AP4-R1]QJU59154.1 ABC transporter substrate-binding protein [Sphingomonas sp. AP4-R1]